MVSIALSLVVGYLVGSVPTAYLFGKAVKKIDIRQHGSGNVGATNAFRILGKGPGTLVLLIDIFKGIFAITIVGNVFGIDRVIWRVLLGVAVVVGHNWTVFLQFRGGKGIATSLGVLIGLTIQYAALRVVLLVTVLSWVVVFLASGYVSLSSMIAAMAMAVMMLLTSQPVELKVLGAVFCAFVLIRHQTNIHRLLARRETKVRFPFQRKK